MGGHSPSFDDLRDQLARSPGDSDLLYACCAAAGEAGEAEMLSLVADRLQSLPSGTEVRLHDLHLYARLREKIAREAGGLSRSNAENTSDLDFRFAREELKMLAGEAFAFLQKDRYSFAAGCLLADALVSLGKTDQAEQVFAQLRRASGTHVASVTNLDPAFHAGLADAAERGLRRLPQVQIVRDCDRSDRLVFTAADYPYFERFGWDFVETFVRQGGEDLCLALHIFDMTDEESAHAEDRLSEFVGLRWKLSREWTGLRGGDGELAAGYYHAVRFVRFWQIMSRARSSGWLIDADTVFNGDPERLFERLADKDVCLFLVPGRFETRNKVMAGCMGAGNTAASFEFLKRVAGYIGHYEEAGRLSWGIDQTALFSVLTMLGKGGSASGPLRVGGVPDWVCSPDRRPDQILRPAKIA